MTSQPIKLYREYTGPDEPRVGDCVVLKSEADAGAGPAFMTCVIESIIPAERTAGEPLVELARPHAMVTDPAGVEKGYVAVSVEHFGCYMAGLLDGYYVLTEGASGTADNRNQSATMGRCYFPSCNQRRPLTRRKESVACPQCRLRMENGEEL